MQLNKNWEFPFRVHPTVSFLVWFLYISPFFYRRSPEFYLSLVHNFIFGYINFYSCFRGEKAAAGWVLSGYLIKRTYYFYCLWYYWHLFTFPRPFLLSEKWHIWLQNLISLQILGNFTLNFKCESFPWTCFILPWAWKL